MITEASIRQRLVQANAGVVLVPTWDEIAFLLDQVDNLHQVLTEQGRDLALMEESLARCEADTRRMGWM